MKKKTSNHYKISFNGEKYKFYIHFLLIREKIHLLIVLTLLLIKTSNLAFVSNNKS